MIVLQRAQLLAMAVFAAGVLVGCMQPTLDLRGPEEMCPIHQEVLREGTVPIIYGEYMPDMEYLQAHTRFFPRANSEMYRGKVPRPETRAKIRYCPHCREAEKAWLKAKAQRDAARGKAR